jgi:hypothetical protein
MRRYCEEMNERYQSERVPCCFHRESTAHSTVLPNERNAEDKAKGLSFLRWCVTRSEPLVAGSATLSSAALFGNRPNHSVASDVTILSATFCLQHYG